MLGCVQNSPLRLIQSFSEIPQSPYPVRLTVTINDDLLTARKGLLKLILYLRFPQIEGRAQRALAFGCDKIQEQYGDADPHPFAGGYQVFRLLEGHLRQNRNNMQCRTARINQQAAQMPEFTGHLHQSLGDFGKSKDSFIIDEYVKEYVEPSVDEFRKL